jgi:protein-tyrosine phosphatase
MWFGNRSEAQQATMIEHVLCVCIGNICRSPAAQVLLAHKLPGLAVSSAGLQALDHRSADPAVIDLLAQRQLDASAHRARTLSAWMVGQADLILVMDKDQKQAIEQQYPQARGRVFRLGEHTGQDIPDPYRQSPEVFRQVVTQIDHNLDQWAPRIQAIGYSAQPPA